MSSILSEQSVQTLSVALALCVMLITYRVDYALLVLR